MPAALEKLTTIIGLMGRLEPGYAQGGAGVGATDGIQLVELPEWPTDDYLYRGDVGGFPGTGAAAPNNPAVGLQLRGIPYKTRVKGAGSAYSASNLPRDIHVGMKVSGHDHVVVTTGGAETVTYTPAPGPIGFASGSYEGYARGQKYAVLGVVADHMAEGADEGPTIFTFPISGILSQLTDVALPAITYAPTVIAPNNNGIALVLGNFVNARLRRWKWALNRKVLGPRTDRNAAGGHGGFGLSPDRAPILTTICEMTAFATTPFHQASALHPGQLKDLGTKLAWAVGPIGGVQYNKHKLSGAQAQVDKWKEIVDPDGIPCWEIDWKISATTPTANDDYSWLFN